MGRDYNEEQGLQPLAQTPCSTPLLAAAGLVAWWGSEVCSRERLVALLVMSKKASGKSTNAVRLAAKSKANPLLCPCSPLLCPCSSCVEGKAMAKNTK